ncbi:neuropeptides capa receptor-like isoform X2 [Tigriopus californicus]|uniref:neuropeptides capa receptor-like isoform X2 n=1 Tax=Tigriopus californicus TaxID=6832 RepID=UPI0027DA51BB|nr:neuropeptides capa receptor-like isoform X2 [Tigriopus californicus]
MACSPKMNGCQSSMLAEVFNVSSPTSTEVGLNVSFPTTSTTSVVYYEFNEHTFEIHAYLRNVLGPQRQPAEKLIPLTIVYIVMFITGVFGNLSVCCVILRIPGMRSATNYYLFSLAVADMLILLLGLPNDLHVYWQQYPWIFGEPLCKIRALVSEMTSYSSVLTIVAFSMERYLAICHPLYSYTMSGLQRASKIIAALWLFALASAIPYAIYTKVHYINHPFTNQTIPESAFCTIQPTPTFLFEFSSFLFFIIPMTIMIFLYVRMGFRIRQTATFGRNTAVHGESRSVQSKKAILKMLAAVVFAFFICWAPFHAQRLLYVVFYEYKWKFVSEEVYQQINEKLFYVTGCFYYFSSTVNPILYNVMSVKYRNAFKETLCGRRSDGGNPLFTSYNPGPGGGGVVSYRRESNAYSTTLANSTRNGHISYGKQMSSRHLSVYDPYGSREIEKNSNGRGQRPRRHSLITEGGQNSIRGARREPSDSRTPSGSSVFAPSLRNQSETSFVDKNGDGLKIVVESESFRT